MSESVQSLTELNRYFKTNHGRMNKNINLSTQIQLVISVALTLVPASVAVSLQSGSDC